jgi:hypothetical protein
VAPHNIECYKCHKYGHIARNCRRITTSSIKKEINIRYTNIWKRKGRQEDHRNKEQVPYIAGFSMVQDQKKYTSKKKYVRYKNIWRINEKQEEQVNKY